MTRRHVLVSLLLSLVAVHAKPRDDTPLIQSYIDRGLPIPKGLYHLRGTVFFAGREVHGIGSTYFHYGDGPAFNAMGPWTGEFSFNYIQGNSFNGVTAFRP